MSDFFIDFNQNLTSSTDFHKHPKIKFHGNPSSCRRNDMCWQTNRRRRTGMTKLTGTFYDYANMPTQIHTHTPLS